MHYINRILHLEVKKTHFEPQEDSANLQDIVDILKALEHRNIDLAPDWYREKYSPEAFATLVHTHNHFHPESSIPLSYIHFHVKPEQDITVSGDTLTITSTTNPNIIGIMYAIHVMMQHHQAHGYVYFNWSNMPVKPGPNSYGGGVAFVTADWSDVHDTSDWCGDKIMSWWESPRFIASIPPRK